MKAEKQVAYIFEDVGGWYICRDDAGMLDARGTAHPSKNAAIRSLRERAGQHDFTHYRTGGTKAHKL